MSKYDKLVTNAAGRVVPDMPQKPGYRRRKFWSVMLFMTLPCTFGVRPSLISTAV